MMEKTELVQLVLRFVADVIRSIIWPVAILVLVFVFRRKIVSLLDRFRKGGIKAGNKEFFFETDTLEEIRKEQHKIGMDRKRMKNK